MFHATSTALPLHRTQDLIAQETGDEVLLYDERTHKAYCLNPTSAVIWNGCDGTRTISDLSELLGALTDQVEARTDHEDAKAIVRFALDQLATDNLITGYSDTQLAVASRRDLLSRGGKALALLLPVIAMIAAPKAAHAYNGCADC